MSAMVADPVEHRGTMPGWGIAADLTPPEVIERRRTRALRKLVAAGLTAAVLVAVAGFAAATLHARAAEDELGTTQDRASALQARQATFREVVAVQAGTRAIDTQIAVLMASDLDKADLLQRLRQLLPGTMSLTSVSLAVTPSADAAAPPVAGADADAATPVGSVTLSGTSQQLADLAAYVSNLEKLEGVVDVLPTTNSIGDQGAASWSVTLQVTDELYTHRYDVDASGDAQ